MLSVAIWAREPCQEITQTLGPPTEDMQHFTHPGREELLGGEDQNQRGLQCADAQPLVDWMGVLGVGSAAAARQVREKDLIFASRIKALKTQVRDKDEKLKELEIQVQARTEAIKIMEHTMRSLHQTVCCNTMDFQAFLNALP